MEIVIENKYAKFWSRFICFYKNFLMFATLGFFLFLLVNGFKAKYFLFPIIFFVPASIYCLVLSRKALYSIKFNQEDRTVEIRVVVFNAVKLKHKIDFKDAYISVQQKFMTVYVQYELIIYKKRDVLFKQLETCGWSHDHLRQIQESFTLLKNDETKVK